MTSKSTRGRKGTCCHSISRDCCIVQASPGVMLTYLPQLQPRPVCLALPLLLAGPLLNCGYQKGVLSPRPHSVRPTCRCPHFASLFQTPDLGTAPSSGRPDFCLEHKLGDVKTRILPFCDLFILCVFACTCVSALWSLGDLSASHTFRSPLLFVSAQKA